MTQTVNKEYWTSRLAFLFAAIGASVGIGNIWKFPYMTGANGGSAFVIIYLFCVIFVAVPLLIAELMLGRRVGLGPPVALLVNAKTENRSERWVWLGHLYLLTGFLILSFFSVVSGWILIYLFTAVTQGFNNSDASSTQLAFSTLLESPGRMTTAHLIFMTINVIIVSFGVRRGIERVAGTLMPALFVLLVFLTAYSFYAGSPLKAIEFMFHFDPTSITSEVFLMAIGQSFLSIGLCSGMMMICGAYLPKTISIPKTAVMIAAADTLVALMAGLVIFPLVFAYGLEPTQGAGLIFETLPIAFGQMPMGYLFGVAFFLLLLFASVTSSVALLEYLVSWRVNSFGQTRFKASVVVGLCAWTIGLLTVLSFNVWSDVRPLGFLSGFADKGIFDLLDYLATNVLLVFGGFMLAIFAGWMMQKDSVIKDLGFQNKRFAASWHIAVRYISPLALGLVMLSRLSS